jgi:hypothetical protein
MAIEFRERRTQEQDFRLEVRKAGELLGHVRRGDGGFFQYYRGALGALDGVTFEFRGRRFGPTQKAHRIEGSARHAHVLAARAPSSALPTGLTAFLLVGGQELTDCS